MQIVPYPHPTLRHKSKPVKRVDAELRAMVSEMFQLMYEANGVGLAANQVDLPVRLFVVNLKADPEEGEELVFINPVITQPKGQEEKEEGCLSLPGLYAPVKRPEKVRVNAFTLSGEEIEGDVTGLMARVIQHETDHLDGVLFTDRLSTTASMSVRDALDEFETAYRSRQERGDTPGNAAVAQRLAQLEQRYC